MFNVHTKVTRCSVPESSLANKSLSEIAQENAINAKYKKDVAQNARAKVVNEAYVADRTRQENIHDRHIFEKTQTTVIEKYHKVFPDIILREYFTELCRRSMIMDKEFVEENLDIIKYLGHGYMMKIGGVKNLQACAEASNSAYLRKLYKVCMEAGKKIADKKIKKARAAKTSEELEVDFSIDDEDKLDLDDKIEDLDIEELSEMVKSKVLQVVKDDNQRASDEKTFFEDLNAMIASLDEDVDGGGDGDDNGNIDDGSNGDVTGDEVKENVNQYFLDGAPVIERSLFRSMMQKVYSDKMKGTSVKESSTDTLSANIANNPMNMNIYDIYLQDGNSDLSFIDYIKNSDETAIAGDDATIDNDEILAEALGLYTVLECASTIKLINPTRDQVNKIIQYNLKK